MQSRMPDAKAEQEHFQYTTCIELSQQKIRGAGIETPGSGRVERRRISLSYVL